MMAKRTKPQAIDLFSGCGGLTLGLKQAGFKVVAAVEVDDIAAITFRANHKRVRLEHADIRTVSASKLRAELGLRRGQLALIAGCPPCQGFSALRTRNGSKRNRDQRNDLINEMVRFVREFRPKAVMMENVPDLEKHDLFRRFCRSLRALGYRINFGKKDAAEFGVPQRRERLILLGGRGFNVDFGKKSRRRRTVRDAIAHLSDGKISSDALHNLPEKRSERIKKLIRDIPKNGGSRTDLPKRRQLLCHKKRNGFFDVYGRMAWDEVAPTITGGCFNPSKGRFLHPDKHRAITMREAASLQSFPPSYKFDMSRGKTAVALMIGNALPPEFIRRQAVSIRQAIEKR
jgi:DNA (cytosine-5)-methyltransferase 1